MKSKEKAVIFIIDDNPSNLKILNGLLTQSGYKVLMARTGENGIQKMQTVQPDLILLDILMPDIDGFETCRRLKESPKTKEIPVIFLTALADTSNKVKGLNIGAVDYITKPFQQKEVVARIELHLKLRNLTLTLEKKNSQLLFEIQQRNLIEEQLKILSLASEQSPASIVITNAQGKIEYVNPKFESVTGYTLAEIKGHNPRILKSGYTSNEEYQKLWQTISSGQEWYGEFHNKRKNGELYWELASISPILDNNNNITHYVAVKEDITERKQAEEQLRNSEEKFKTIFNHASDAIIIHDLKGNFLEVNSVLCERLGYTRSQLLQMTPQDVNAPQYIALIPSRLEQVQDQGHLIFETIHLKSDGTPIPVEVNSRLIQFEGKTAIMSIARDITQRKQMEKALQTERNFSSAVIETVGALIIVLDCSGQIVRFNRACEILSGYNFREIKGLKFWNFLIITEEIDLIKTGFQNLQEGHFPNQFENYWVAKDGTRRLIEWHNTILKDGSGQTQYIIGTGIDITERRQVEDQIRQLNATLEKRVEERTQALRESNAELARATRLKDEFLANMSHELRTPLNAILGMSEGLLEEIYGSLNGQQVKCLKTIERSGKHLLELINDILDLSKIESGKLQLSIAPCNIRSLCTSSLTFVKQQALKKNIKLITSIEENPEVVELDERRMRQVLINLLNNAVKFTPPGGKVILEVRFIETPPTIIFSVKDSGIGIAKEDKEKLFQAFTQLDSSLNRAQEGTGLGLALVRLLSELHGGTVNVDSEVGVGSCFYVTLPYHSRKNTPKPELEKKPLKTFTNSPTDIGTEVLSVSTIKSPLILLAEDNEATIETLSDYLECKGYQLILAHNGQEALTLAQTRQPHLILMDIQMPEMDGLEAITRIRTEPDLAKIPIIALTALAMADDPEKCLCAGANQYLSKPVSLKHLTNTIEQLLASKY